MTRRRNSQQGKVLPFRRGARRHPKWDLGTPPGRPRRPRQNWRGRFGLGVAVLTLGSVALPPVGDAINGFVKPKEGCRVVGIIDGDTVRLLCPGKGVISGRVVGYDTPEKKARCLSEFLAALSATQYLRWILWSGAQISARTQGEDRYGRALTMLSVDGQNVAERMVGAGLARRYDGGQRQGWCAE